MAISAEEIFRTTTLTREASQEVASMLDGAPALEPFFTAMVSCGSYSVGEIVDRLRALKGMLR